MMNRAAGARLASAAKILRGLAKRLIFAMGDVNVARREMP